MGSGSISPGQNNGNSTPSPTQQQQQQCGSMGNGENNDDSGKDCRELVGKSIFTSMYCDLAEDNAWTLSPLRRKPFNSSFRH